MLSGETANGSFPVIAVETMAKICSEAELCYDNEATFWARIKGRGQLSEAEALSASAVQMSFELRAAIIVCFTLTGEIARLISKYRPKVPIVAIRYFNKQNYYSTEDKTIKSLTISSGVTCLRVPSFQGIDTLVEYAIKSAKERGLCKAGDRVIILLGGTEENPDESNILKIKAVVWVWMTVHNNKM